MVLLTLVGLTRFGLCLPSPCACIISQAVGRVKYFLKLFLRLSALRNSGRSFDGLMRSTCDLGSLTLVSHSEPSANLGAIISRSVVLVKGFPKLFFGECGGVEDIPSLAILSRNLVFYMVPRSTAGRVSPPDMIIISQEGRKVNYESLN